MKNSDSPKKYYEQEGFVKCDNCGKNDEKYAHKYNLKVKWNKTPEWNINILAINAEVISMWLPKEETEENYIMNVEIKLLERNVQKVKATFLAKGID